MSHSSTTPNYDLPLFADDDTPTWLGDWNQGMNAVDAALNGMKNTVSDHGNQVANLTTRVEKVETDSKGYGGDIAANAAQIAAVKTTADNALSLAKTNEGDISLAEQRITTNEGKIGAVDGRVDNLAERVSKNENAIAGLTQKAAKPVIVVIGDSYSVRTGTWVQDFIEANPNLDVRVYASGGSGLATDGSGENFLKQANRAISELSAVKNAVSAVVVYGGVNDYRNSASVITCKNNLQTLLVAINTAFPKAAVHLFAMNWGKKPFDAWSYLSAWQDAAHNVPCCSLHDGCRYWAFGEYADELHPTSDGYARIASHIATALNGGEPTTEFKCELTASGGASIGSLEIVYRDGAFILKSSNCTMPTTGQDEGSGWWRNVQFATVTPAPLKDVFFVASRSANPCGMYVLISKTTGAVGISEQIPGGAQNQYATPGSTFVPMDGMAYVM